MLDTSRQEKKLFVSSSLANSSPPCLEADFLRSLGLWFHVFLVPKPVYLDIGCLSLRWVEATIQILVPAGRELVVGAIGADAKTSNSAEPLG